MPLVIAEGVGTLVWSPLGWSRLTGKLRRGVPVPAESRLHVTAEAGPQVPDDRLYDVVDALDAVAAETGRTVPQLALRWLLQRPMIASVIIGARDEAQLRANLAAVDFTLTPEQMARLDAASDVTPAYPYWRQRGAGTRNPAPA